MKVKNVSYSKVFPLGGYSNEKIGVEIEVGENENPVEALFEAKKYVERSHLFNKQYRDYEEAQRIIKDEANFTGNQRKQANTFVEDFEANFNDFLSTAAKIKQLSMLHPKTNDDLSQPEEADDFPM
jgi:hypothetical protein